ncbi:MAG: alpha-ketoacid dehydrogenase subunit beta, partial [Haloferacaceae archaeon]
AEIQFSGFVPPAFNQLVQNASRIRWRTRGEHSAPMVVRAPYGGGVRALEHHSESLEAAYAHVPGLKVVVPATPRDAKGLLAAAVRDPDPVLFLEPKRYYRGVREEVPDGAYAEPLGEARVRREGEDVTLVSWGASLHPTLSAAENLAAEGVDAEVVDLRTVSPFDRETVVESVKKTGRAAVVHEAPRTGGFAAELIATLNEEALYHLEAPIERVTGFDTPIPMLAREDYYLPNPPRVEEGVKRVLEA